MIHDLPSTSLDILPIEVEEQHFLLHPHKAVYWQETSTLIITDLHLGKIQHFRKAGIYVPSYAANDNFERLSSLLLEFAPDNLLILGDLFHSDYNADWKTFSEVRQTFPEVSFLLVPGNHDILDARIIKDNDITMHRDDLYWEPFVFSHFPTESAKDSCYRICGHLHPGVQLVGESKQSLTLPCFYFGRTQGVLPAFGTFTGISKLRPEAGDQVVVISDEQLALVC